VLAPLDGLGDALARIKDLVTDPIVGAAVPMPLFAHTIAGATERYWYLPLSLDCDLDVDGSGGNDVRVRVDPILDGTSVVGVTILLRRLTEVQFRIGVGLRSDAGLVTSPGAGNWARTDVAHQQRPLPDVTTITLRSTGRLNNPGDTQDTRVTLTVQGGSVGTGLDHALAFGARGGGNVTGVATAARRPDAIAGLPIPVPANQTIYVPPTDQLAGADTRIAGATGALTGAGPHLSLRQQSTFLETIASEKVLDSTLTVDSSQRLNLDVDTAKPAKPTAFMELRDMTRHLVVREQPQREGGGATRRLDGTFVQVTADDATDSATLRLATAAGGVAATIFGLADLSLRLRGEAPLLIELHGGTDPTQPLAQTLPGFAALGHPDTHPAGTPGQVIELAPQAVLLDLETTPADETSYAVCGRMLRRLRVRERVAGVHARADSLPESQDWLLEIDFGDLSGDMTRGPRLPERPLRVRLRSDGSTTLARAVHLPESVVVDLHVDPPGDDRDFGMRVQGAAEGLRVLTDAPPAEAGEARTRVHAAVPVVPGEGAEFDLIENLPTVSASGVATVIVAAHGLGVPAAEGGMALESLDVLAQVPPVTLPPDRRPDTASLSVTARHESGGLAIAAAQPTGVRAALSSTEQRRAVRSTPQVGMAFAPAPDTLSEPLGAEMQKVTARVVGLGRVELGGDPAAGPVPLPDVHLVLADARVNRSARIHTFDGDRADLRVRIVDVPDDLAIDLRTEEPVGIGGTIRAPMRRPARMELQASARSGEIFIWGEPAARAWYGPAAGRLAGIGLVTGRVESLPPRVVFAQLHDPALLSSEDETRPELWSGIGSEWVRDGLRLAVSEELVACRLAIVSWDRDHPSNGEAKWSYTYIHGLKLGTPPNPSAVGAAVDDLPSLTIWTPFQVPRDDDTFDEGTSALSIRVGPRDGHDDDDRPPVDLWLGKLERGGGTGFVEWRDVIPATSFATKSEIILSSFKGHVAVAEEFGTFDPTRIDANGPGDWWVRAVGKLPLLGYDVTIGSDGIQGFAERPDFDDPCGG
jgi:hypothetical protein